MSNPTLADIQNSAKYQELAVMAHDDLIPFVQKAMQETSVVTILYWLINGVMLTVSVYAWLGTPFFDGLSIFGAGILLGYVLIIPHEHLHGLAYRLLGAKDVRISYRWKQLTAICVAHEFVVGKASFWFVALLPFTVITLSIIILVLVLPQFSLVWCGVLFFHTAACSGDFALVNYFWKRHSHTIYTYDDADQNLSYFIRESK